MTLTAILKQISFFLKIKRCHNFGENLEIPTIVASENFDEKCQSKNCGFENCGSDWRIRDIPIRMCTLYNVAPDFWLL